MNRAALEHIIRASAVIADDNEIIIIGSQSILAQFPNAAADLLVSEEADVFPKNFPERADLIDGSIGELSPFHDTFGYYAQGVAAETAILPAGWQQRLIAITNENTRGAIGWCLEIHDLIASKLLAGREKDVSYFRTAKAAGYIDVKLLQSRLSACDADKLVIARALEHISAV